MQLQEFFNNSLECGFIKNILSNIAIPLYDTISLGDYIVKGGIYAYKTTIIRCTQSGYFYVKGFPAALRINERLKVQNEGLVITDGAGDQEKGSEAKWEQIAIYTFGKDSTNLTQTFDSKYSYYDSETHKYLGNYLRCIRDIFDINLMPYYNCFSYNILNNVRIYYYKDPERATKLDRGLPDDSGWRCEIAEDTNYKYIVVPIKYNKTYSISIDCPSPVIVMPVLYGYNSLISIDINGETKDITNDFFNKMAFVKEFNRLDFRKPVKMQVDLDNFVDGVSGINQETLYILEDYLYLLIRLPAENKSSIVVLEGDYTSTYCKNTINMEYADINNVDKFTPHSFDMVNQVVPSLIQVNTGVSYPYSNRLVEYLTTTPITNITTIKNNLLNVNKKLGLKENDFWDNYIRLTAYNRYMERDITNAYKFDISGFIDRTVEEALDGGKLNA